MITSKASSRWEELDIEDGRPAHSYSGGEGGWGTGGLGERKAELVELSGL